ncbi:hypothetical protein [Sphingobacterium sp. HMA12]|uniref:hypothetical protein n=1 Tax=Sphingobacterium sp. HMA12 TaxID=2050894 RepID=UPI000CEA49F9|nr:hypothetical protein [Sphingobacterium sp. HMA12]
MKTYVINLIERYDRLKHIKQEFENRHEFDVTYIEGIKHVVGSIGLMESFKICVKDAKTKGLPFVLICEDDHMFTSAYTWDKLKACVSCGMYDKFDILLGGVSGFQNAIPYNDNLFWIENFSGAQFTIVFQKFFEKFLEIDLGPSQNMDIELKKYTSNIFAIFPQISVQKSFGYSDITKKNNTIDVESYFKISEERFKKILTIDAYYRKVNNRFIVEDLDFNIPTYVIPFHAQYDIKHLKIEFKGKNEFDLRFASLVKLADGSIDRLNTLKNIVMGAKMADEDVIIVCDDTHTFTTDYNCSNFKKAIINAYYLKTKMLLCALLGEANNILFINNSFFWIDSFLGTSFIVLYKSSFQNILDLIPDNMLCYEEQLSSITSNKLVLFPTISVSRNNSDIDAQMRAQHYVWNTSYLLTKEQLEKLFKKSVLLGRV